MSRQFRPLPENVSLEPTLARRVNQLREFRNMTVRDLAKVTKLTVQRIEDIEGGLETWLSTTDRQLLAKALVVEPNLLQEVETRQTGMDSEVRYSAENLAEQILAGNRDLTCPNCAGALRCSVQHAFDLDGNPTAFAKAFCVKCPFVLK